MKKVLIVQQNTNVLSTKQINELNTYVRDSFEEGVLVLNKDLSYEVVEIDVKEKVEVPVNNSEVEKCDGEVVGADENH